MLDLAVHPLTCHRTGEEIRSLSRFQVAQRIGFTKILKKYRRWTRDKELGHAFKEEISNHPDSLFQLDLGYLLDQYMEVLDALRSIFYAEGVSASTSAPDMGQSSAARLTKALEQADELDFDMALTTVPLGSKGTKATYWVHPDHMVEVQVLLLQHMRLYTGSTGRFSRRGSTQTTPHRRHSSSANVDKTFGNEDQACLIVLDYPETYAIRQNASTIGSSEESQGSIGTKALGNVRCIASGKAAVVVCDQDASGQTAGDIKMTKLDRKALSAYLDTSNQRPSLQRSNSQSSQLRGISKENFVAVRQWLEQHPAAKPIAGAMSKRIRFTGLHNNSVGGIWASLDTDVLLKGSLHKDLDHENWILSAQSSSVAFPHAVLEVRREGSQATSLIQTLDKSHLVRNQTSSMIMLHPIDKNRLNECVAFRWKLTLCGHAVSQLPCLRPFGCHC